jgi:pimeloyl-ACP methyl ester carboxylesterase
MNTRLSPRLWLSTVAVSALVSTACGADDSAAPSVTSLHRTEFSVSSAPGISLAVRELRSSQTADGTGIPVLLVHGARVPGKASFDLPVPGGSLAADLADAGHAVYVMDVRGYGDSTRTAALEQPRTANPPAVRSDEAVADVAAVVDEIIERSNSSGGPNHVALLGWATGGHWAGQYAAENPDKVSHVVFYNSLYGPVDRHPTLGRGSDYEDPSRPGEFNAGEFGAYRFNTAAGLLPSWDRSIPVADKSEWRDPVVVDAYVDAAVASDPTAHTRTPPSFRSPSGALEDSFYLATGQQLWDASNITASALVVRSEFDFWSRPEDPQVLQADLMDASSVRSIELSGATHYAHLDRTDKGRGQFLTEVLEFLDSTR